MADSKDGGAAGGSGKIETEGIAEAVARIAKTIEDVNRIIKGLTEFDEVTSRSVVCEIDNVSCRTLRFEDNNFDHGGLQDLPPPSITDKSAGLFSARSSGVFVGVQGTVTYTIDDAKGSRFVV